MRFKQTTALLVAGVVGVAAARCATVALKSQPPSVQSAMAEVDQYAGTLFRKYQVRDEYEFVVVDQNVGHWQRENWTSDDGPFKTARQEVDTAIEAGADPKVVAYKYQAQTEERPNDPLLQFTWGYALWRSTTSTTPFVERYKNNLAVFYALVHAGSPDAYNYSRLRYLASPNDDNLAALGERLLQRKPDDADVKAHLVGDYTGIVLKRNPTAKARAVGLATLLIKEHPKVGRYYALLGAVYGWNYAYTHNRQDALEAIKVFKKYLAIAAPDENFRPTAEAIVKDYQAELAKTNE